LPDPVVISLGSNVEPERFLPMALRRLQEIGPVEAVSTVYENPAVGPDGQPAFLNAAVRLASPIGPDELRTRLRAIEADLGRVRTGDRYAPRRIDLDILIFAGRIMDADLVNHTHLAVTAAEVAPDFEPAKRMDTTRLVPRPEVDLGLILKECNHCG
jgi:2-amino-4-hydroxy-6-hydroxymethyldihydropteridine diphosphokinase